MDDKEMLGRFDSTVDQAMEAATQFRRESLRSDVSLPSLDAIRKIAMVEGDPLAEEDLAKLVDTTARVTVRRVVGWMGLAWRYHEGTGECPPGRDLASCKRTDGCQACWFDWLTERLWEVTKEVE